jgi:hypothetical protein
MIEGKNWISRPWRVQTPTKPAFATASLNELVRAHNALVGELNTIHNQDRPVRMSFPNKPAAISSCEHLWLEIVRQRHLLTKGKQEHKAMDTNTEVMDEVEENVEVAETPKKTRAKKAPAKKAAPVKAKTKGKKAPVTADKVGRGRQPNYPDNAKIRLLVKENPARGGTSSHEFFETAKAAKTFGVYRANGGNLKYLYWFQERGKLEIVA